MKDPKVSYIFALEPGVPGTSGEGFLTCLPAEHFLLKKKSKQLGLQFELAVVSLQKNASTHTVIDWHTNVYAYNVLVKVFVMLANFPRVATNLSAVN